MHKIDHSTAAAGNQFTDGNPVTGIPATRVTAKWLNSIQNELAALVEAAGLTLSDSDEEQVKKSIFHLIQSYGLAPVELPNNTTTWTDLLTLDSDKIASAVIVINAYRKTATAEIRSWITLKPVFLPNLGEWKMPPVIEESVGDLSGVEFRVDAETGKIQFKTSNLSGGSYEGSARYKLTSFNVA